MIINSNLARCLFIIAPLSTIDSHCQSVPAETRSSLLRGLVNSADLEYRW